MCAPATRFEINFGNWIFPRVNMFVVYSDLYNLLVRTIILFYFQKGTVMHELAHAQGIIHEQSRMDRDNYVTIKFENIISDKEYNFEKHADTKTDGFPYDYQSMMHYGDKVRLCVCTVLVQFNSIQFNSIQFNLNFVKAGPPTHLPPHPPT